MERFTDLREKEVINILDGQRLGFVCDLVIDICTGNITAIIVPGGSRIAAFFKGNGDIIIPWRKIIKIGCDVILCEVDSCIDK